MAQAKTSKETSEFISSTLQTGTRWMNMDTGEVIEADEITKEYVPNSRRGFVTMYISKLAEALVPLGNKKIEVFVYILENMNKNNNKLTETVDVIASKSGISRNTVLSALQLLEEADIITRNTGDIMLHPRVACRGDGRKEAWLMIKFKEMKGER